MSSIQEQRDVVARKRRRPLMLELSPPSAPASEFPRPPVEYFARMYAPGRSYVVQIETAEDFFILDEAIGQPEHDQMEIWAVEGRDPQLACRIFPAESPEAASLLNNRLTIGRPQGSAVFDRPDGIQLILRTCDTFAPVIAAHAYMVTVHHLSRMIQDDPQLKLFSDSCEDSDSEHFRVMADRAAELAEADVDLAEILWTEQHEQNWHPTPDGPVATEFELEEFAPEYHPGYTVAQARADQERVYAHATTPLTMQWTEADFKKWREQERFRRSCSGMGLPVTETPDGPVVIAGRYVGGILVDPKYEDVT